MQQKILSQFVRTCANLSLFVIVLYHHLPLCLQLILANHFVSKWQKETRKAEFVVRMAH